jgi:hypothetical protein
MAERIAANKQYEYKSVRVTPALQKPIHSATVSLGHGLIVDSRSVDCLPSLVGIGLLASARCVLQNSNLVLMTENRTRNDEPTGEPETLWGKSLHAFGDRAVRGKPREVEELQRLEVSPRKPAVSQLLFCRCTCWSLRLLY